MKEAENKEERWKREKCGWMCVSRHGFEDILMPFFARY